MLRTLLKFWGLLFILLSTSQLYAQRYEAENAVLAGGARAVANASASNGYHVAQEEGNLTFSINLEEEGFYNILLHAAAPYGKKTNVLEINGASIKFVLASNSQFKTFQLVSTLKLPAGTNQLRIIKEWGWINIDYIALEKVDAEDRFNLDQSLVTPDPIPEATALYDFLLDHYGRKIISGAMTLNDIASSPWADWIEETSGKEVALMGMDLMHSFRGYNWVSDEAPFADAKGWYARKGIPALMWHWRDPSRQTEGFYTEATDFDISKIFEPESPEYIAMLADIDLAAEQFIELQEEGVPVLWRPMHEAAGGWFWWGAKGPEPLKELWHIMYDRMVHHHGVRNLIWVWTREPGDDAWYPGHDYVDIVARDIYREGDHGSHVLEFNDMNRLYEGRKMLTLGEIGSIPDPDQLKADGAAWSWFMPWYGEHTVLPSWNSKAIWQKVMNHDYVITLDEMPDLRTYQRQEEEPEPEPTSIQHKSLKKLSMLAYPVPVANDLLLESDTPIRTFAVYNTLGTLLREEKASGNKAKVSFAGLAPGIYMVQVNGRETIRVVKK